MGSNYFITNVDFTLWIKHLHVFAGQIRYSVFSFAKEQEHGANVDHFHAVEQPVYHPILCKISQALWGDGRQPKIWMQPGWPKSGEVITQTDNWRLPRAQGAQWPFKQQWLGVFLFNLTLQAKTNKKIFQYFPHKVCPRMGLSPSLVRDTSKISDNHSSLFCPFLNYISQRKCAYNSFLDTAENCNISSKSLVEPMSQTCTEQ